MSEATSFFELISKGGLVMIPIGLCSVIALAIIIERLHYFRKCSLKLDVFFILIQELLQRGQKEKVLNHCKTSPNPLAKLIQSGLSEDNLPRWKLEEKLSLAGQEEINILGKNIKGLEVIATISPLLGLLGTVIGMVQAFSKVAEYQGQVDPAVLAGGIWVALLTTAAGLAVAIPAVIMLNYFEKKIEVVTFQLSKYGQLFIHLLDNQNSNRDNL